MMTEGFTRALGAKIGTVLEVGQAVNNYKKERVDFPLEKAILQTVQQKVRGHGVLEFLVRYQNIPNFCFGCGRIVRDHANARMKDQMVVGLSLVNRSDAPHIKSQRANA